MMKNIVKKNILLFTVILFLSLFSFFVYFKPNTVFDKDGSPLNFGLGYTKKTILPIWLIVIIISIISYLFILFYVNSNKFVL
jgi:quinol-cytochrome oxidoreductase complex cytochrome b subunit